VEKIVYLSERTVVALFSGRPAGERGDAASLDATREGYEKITTRVL
jgi:hypothetical protein